MLVKLTNSSLETNICIYQIEEKKSNIEKGLKNYQKRGTDTDGVVDGGGSMQGLTAVVVGAEVEEESEREEERK